VITDSFCMLAGHWRCRCYVGSIRHTGDFWIYCAS